jgi:hypothetical protein
VDSLHALLVRVEIPVVYAFLLRFPILCMLFLVGFRWIALRLKPDLLANLFDVDGPGTFWVTLAALLCAWAIFVTGWNIYSHGPGRFWMGDWPPLGPPPLWGYAAAAVLGLICVSGVFSYSPGQNPSRSPRGLWLGFTAGLLGGVVLLAIMRVSATHLGSWRLGSRFVAWACKGLGSHGYVDEHGDLYPEHLVALSLFLVSLLLYGVLGLFKRTRQGRPSGIPTLVYVLLLLMLATWTLPALSFALDPITCPSC